MSANPDRLFSSDGFMSHGMCHLWFLGMPYVDGKVVAEAVKAIRPQAPVVLLTGWGHRILAENNTTPSVGGVLGKPPNLVILRSVLAEPTSAALT